MAVEIIKDSYLDNTYLIDGVRYTSQEDQNKLSNDDFLELLLTEMKMQDPTKPMDSAAMMDSQLQMSTIESNMAMADSMAALKSSYSNSALSTAAGMIGNTIENGSIDDAGRSNSFKVETIENRDGEIYINTKQILGLIDNLVSVDGDTTTSLDYDSEGYIYEAGDKTDIRVKLTQDGRFDFDANTQIQLLDEAGEIITDSDTVDKYKYVGTSYDYSPTFTTMLMSSITKVR